MNSFVSSALCLVRSYGIAMLGYLALIICSSVAYYKPIEVSVSIILGNWWLKYYCTINVFCFFLEIIAR